MVRYIHLNPVCAGIVKDVKALNKYPFTGHKQRTRVEARSLLCYWAVRDLGITMAELARRLNLSLSWVSLSVKRGGRIAQEKGYKLTAPQV